MARCGISIQKPAKSSTLWIELPNRLRFRMPSRRRRWHPGMLHLKANVACAVFSSASPKKVSNAGQPCRFPWRTLGKVCFPRSADQSPLVKCRAHDVPGSAVGSSSFSVANSIVTSIFATEATFSASLSDSLESGIRTSTKPSKGPEISVLRSSLSLVM